MNNRRDAKRYPSPWIRNDSSDIIFCDQPEAYRSSLLGRFHLSRVIFIFSCLVLSTFATEHALNFSRSAFRVQIDR